MQLHFDTEIDMCAAEQIMLRHTIQELADNGWELEMVSDSEENVAQSDIDEALKYVSGIDDYIFFHFVREDTTGWIMYVPGNMVDCIADYSSNLTEFPKDLHSTVSKFF